MNSPAPQRDGVEERAIPDDPCLSCGGKGDIDDTTYDRTGWRVECARCFGSGLSQDGIRAIVRKALSIDAPKRARKRQTAQRSGRRG